MATYSWDVIGKDIDFDFYYEREELELLWQFLSPLHSEFSDGVFLDIGANIGNHSRFFYSKFSEIHSFEPHPDTFDLLKFNMKHISNSKVYNIGLGDREEQLNIETNESNRGASRISTDSLNDELIKIDVRRLDDFSFESISLVKVDTEGFEEKVLNGAKKHITNHLPVIVFEQSNSDFIDGKSSSIELLRSLGYRFVWQRNPSSYIDKRLNHARKYFRRKHRLFTGETIPVCFHEMIIAIPSDRFSLFTERLG